ncbi:MAG: hypothetical protein LBD32_01525, partial [Cytophagales bacterium]|nr:hypothetical protein [Cytophagales bacterium]
KVLVNFLEKFDKNCRVRLEQFFQRKKTEIDYGARNKSPKQINKEKQEIKKIDFMQDFVSIASDEKIAVMESDCPAAPQNLNKVLNDPPAYLKKQISANENDLEFHLATWTIELHSSGKKSRTYTSNY